MLLAKTRVQGRILTLAKHCLDTEESAVAVFAERTLDSWCRYFRLVDTPAFLRDLRVACLFHDLGKANADFQDAVSGQRQGQAIRHEHLSGLVLCLPRVREWIQSAGCDYDAVVAAVLSHHAKVSGRRQDDFFWAADLKQPPVRTFFTHPDCVAILQRAAALLGTAAPESLPCEAWPSSPWRDAWQAGMEAADELELPPEEVFSPRRNHLLAVKAGTVVADAVASALWREQRDRDAFLAQSLRRPPLTGVHIREHIIERRIAHLRKSGVWSDWSDFQGAADRVGARAVVVAGCGSGKTLFAWRWAAAVADSHRIGSVVFLYPTRATATEGFKDYVAWAPEAEATLLTGTAAIELAGLARNPVEATHGKVYEDEGDARLFALANWKRSYFSATLDQFLSFLEHGYSGLCLLPQLADSALILDEVHSLDRDLFARVLALLTHFDGPVLLMSATMPQERLEALRRVGMRIFPNEDERSTFSDLRSDEARPRYHLTRVSQWQAAFHLVQHGEHHHPPSTLWVVNTVKRCQSLALAARQAGLQPLVYHSRFTARDRRRRHEAVVAAFKDRTVPKLAITTQVCEMSLDLDADRLISEEAPLPALIQRLGRANRSRSREWTFRAEVITYPPQDALPYSQEDGGREALLATGRFCADNAGRELSQSDLATALTMERYSPTRSRPSASAGFLAGGWFATARPLRGEEGDHDVRCVLTTDLDRGLGPDGIPGEEEPMDAWVLQVPRRFVLSMPQRGAEPQEQRPTWLMQANLHLADGRRYDSQLGFLLVEVD